MLPRSGTQVRVTVYNHKDKTLEAASVSLRSSEPSESRVYKLEYDSSQGCYASNGKPPGRYLLTAKADGYATEERPVQVDPAGLRTKMILGTPGLPFLYRGGIKKPFEPYLDLIAVALAPGTAGPAAEQFGEIASKYHLTPVELGATVPHKLVRVFRFPAGVPESDQQEIGQSLQDVTGVEAVGPLVHFEMNGLSILTNELVVKLRPQIHPDRLLKVGQEMKIEIEFCRSLPQAGNAYLFRLPGWTTYTKLMDVTSKLLESKLVDYAEPNLISTSVNDHFQRPRDFLFPRSECWCPRSTQLCHAQQKTRRPCKR